jgi:TPR repeat protein
MTTAMTPTATITAPFTSTPESREAFAEARRLISDRDFSGAITLLTPFACSGDRNILFTLNYAHERRRLPGDRQKSLAYLKEAAELGHQKATEILARRKVARLIGSKGQMTDLRPFLVSAAKAFFPLEITSSTELDTCGLAELTASVGLALEEASKSGDRLAQTALAVTLLHAHTPTDASNAKALSLLQSAIDDGQYEAIRFLGRAYLDGTLIPADFTKAFELFRFGSEMGCTESRHRYAECYLRGTGVEADIPVAVRILKENTKAGHPYSPCLLGALYLEGTKVPQDIILGRDLLKLSASRRCATAAAQLAHFFLWNPEYALIGYERQAYAYIAKELGDDSKREELARLPLAEFPELLKSVKLIKSVTPEPNF